MGASSTPVGGAGADGDRAGADGGRAWADGDPTWGDGDSAAARPDALRPPTQPDVLRSPAQPDALRPTVCRPDAARRSAAPLDPAIRDRLAGEKHVWLCTVRPDGSPHVTPVWFVFLRDSWWIGADGGSVKVRNVRRYARVSLALEDGRFPVVAEGEAVVRPGASAFPADVTEAFAAKYAWDVTAPHRPGEQRVLLEVPVRRWLLAGTAQ
ncbi:pyridoxamine 5'-phosphate oxidase family protein [Streptomyces sp. NPDC012510]|jgi:PPOX class probable F420-dependent enzyme|uniref:pyridoxamine 5'-phosphate oxidase family protein n=1 Tax=Streptomyces sp. NPDC012510 TaxID=3364838 RepID=UPI0036E3F789